MEIVWVRARRNDAHDFERFRRLSPKVPQSLGQRDEILFLWTIAYVKVSELPRADIVSGIGTF